MSKLLLQFYFTCHHRIIHVAALLCSESCDRKFCAFGAECVVNNDSGQAACRCITHCDVTVTSATAVCGSDNSTYDSKCHLRVVSCNQRRRIRVRWRGTCGMCLRPVIHSSLSYLFTYVCCRRKMSAWKHWADSLLQSFFDILWDKVHGEITICFLVHYSRDVSIHLSLGKKLMYRRQPKANGK